MLNILCVGDLHIRKDNFSDIDLLLQKLVSHLLTKKYSYIVLLGDILHTHERLNTICHNKAIEFMEKLSEFSKLYVLVGNHDYINNSQFLSSNHWMNALKKWENITIVDDVTVVNTKFNKLTFCPYVPNGRFLEALKKREEDDCLTSTVIFAHQEFYGCKMNAITSEEGDKWNENYPQVISGHIHSKQKLQNNIFYTGAAMQHAFGESTENIILSLKITNERKLIFKEIDFKMPRKKIIKYSVDELMELDNPNILLNKLHKKIKLTITGDINKIKLFKKSLIHKKISKTGCKIVYKSVLDNKESEMIEKIQESDFKKILYSTLKKYEEEKLIEIYDEIFN